MLKLMGFVSGRLQSYKDVWSKSLSVTLFFITSLIFFPLIYHFSVALQPSKIEASNGFVSIKHSDFSSRNTLALAGEWAFYWQQLLDPEQIKSTKVSPSFVQANGGWQSQSNKQSYQAIGYATYHLDLSLQSNSNNLALQIPAIESAYKVFVNSDLMATGGQISEVESSARPNYHTTIVKIPDGLTHFSITLQVSNYHSSWGGLWKPIVLGDIHALHTLQRDKVALSMFILGTLLITVVHSLIQYFLRPKDNIPLVFACLCILLFLREFTVEHMSFILSTLSGGFVLITKLNFFSYYAGFPVGLYFFHLCYPKEFHRKFCILMYSICTLFSIFVLVFPTRYFGGSVVIFQLLAMVIMFYIFQRTWLAMKNNRRGAGVMLLGSIIAFGFVFNDILNMNNLISTGRFFSLGVIGFIVCQSFVTNGRFDNYIDKNAALTEKLKERNADLELLSGLLETKVEQRTQQLQKANKELKALANNDPLTKAYNRHGLQQYIMAAFERYRRTQEPFSILILDYDHFKQINDNYGHDVGDLVLMTGADLIKQTMREQDKLARWGGEEFLVLLPGTDLEGALSIGQKLKDKISAKPIGQPLGITVTVTIGVAQIQPAESFDKLFKRADDALYKGKQAGRNQICH